VVLIGVRMARSYVAIGLFCWLKEGCHDAHTLGLSYCRIKEL
jgi:hypothetical protein